MDRKRIPRQHRRYSLPAASSLTPLGYSRIVPEGSDTFQKALEELYTHEPDHAPSREVNGVALNGLNNIQEGNESDFVESEDELEEDSALLKLNRRHSSPSFFKEDEDSRPSLSIERMSKIKKETNSTTIKSHTKHRKDYFIKHGRWPTVNNTQDIKRRPSSQYDRSMAFGTSKSLPSKMDKLRV